MTIGCESFRRMSRRQALQLGGAGLFGLGLSDFFQARAEPNKKAQADHLIVIWLGGGPPHIDMFDMKPEAPADVRGEFKPIKTNVPGMEICELMPELAKVADKYTILRSVGIGNESYGHSGGAYWLTGNPRRANTQKFPMYGSVMAKLRPATRGVPSFVGTGPYNHSNDLHVNYMGPTYDPLTFNPAKPDDQVRAMLASPGLDLRDLERDEKFLGSVGRQLRKQDEMDPVIAGLDKFQQQAFDMIRSPKLREALDLSKEPKKSYERYDVKGLNGGFGSSDNGLPILAARRLVEAGVPAVFVPIGYWDYHSNNFKQCRKALPSLSRSVAALIEDLDERGLLERTIVTVVGEMGRTPKVEKGGGRGHWGTAQSVLVAGGGFKGGTVVGATDKSAAYVTDKPYKVESFGRTLYNQLGIDADQELYTTTGRPMKIILEDAPLIKEALA